MNNNKPEFEKLNYILGKLAPEKTSDNFTNNVMNKVLTSKAPVADKSFLYTIVALFSLGIVATVAVYIYLSPSSIMDKLGFVNIGIELPELKLNDLSGLLHFSKIGEGLKAIGWTASILSLFTAYYLYESHKTIKDNLKSKKS